MACFWVNLPCMRACVLACVVPCGVSSPCTCIPCFGACLVSCSLRATLQDDGILHSSKLIRKLFVLLSLVSSTFSARSSSKLFMMHVVLSQTTLVGCHPSPYFFCVHLISRQPRSSSASFWSPCELSFLQLDSSQSRSLVASFKCGYAGAIPCCILAFWSSRAPVHS